MSDAERLPGGRALRLVVALLLVAGLVEAFRRLLRAPDDPAKPVAPRASDRADWPPFETTPEAEAEPEPPPWVEPVDGTCPDTHPVKGKLSSGIYHLPGMLNYERTRPDRCYRSGDAAEADGLRKAKR